jgi:transcription antitermination factor NusG
MTEIANYDRLDTEQSWYALYTKHQHEKVVARNLACKGFETFVPLYESARNWKDRVQVLEVPLFSCYVFFKGNLERRLDIVTTPGIYCLVSYGGEPAAIPAAEMEDIRHAIQSGARLEPHPFLKCGDWVRVKCGPLAGIQGILVRKKNVCRLVLSVEILGKSAAVEIDGFLVERLAKNDDSLASLAGTRRPDSSHVSNLDRRVRHNAII